MQHDHALKKLNFDLLTPSPGSGWGGSAVKIFATILLQSWFLLIWYAAWTCSEKLNVLNPTPWSRGWCGGGSAGKIFPTMLHSWLPLMWYATWPCSERVWMLTFWPHPLGLPSSRTQAFDRKSIVICFIFIVSLSACKISVKYWQLTELLRN